MATSNLRSQSIGNLRRSISSYTPGRVSVISVSDQFQSVPSIVHDMRRALLGERVADRQDGHLTNSISLIVKSGHVTQSELRATAMQFGCMVILVRPAYVSRDAALITLTKNLTGRVPLCALLEVSDVSLMMRAREGLPFTAIYEVPNRSDPLSEKKILQWLQLLQGCLQKMTEY